MENAGSASRLQFDKAIVPQLERWVRRIIGAGYNEDLERLTTQKDRVRWVMEQLGIVDESLATALVESMNRSDSVEEAARRVWSEIRPWPGQLWSQRLDSHQSR